MKIVKIQRAFNSKAERVIIKATGALRRGFRPTKRAIRMANALELEERMIRMGLDLKRAAVVLGVSRELIRIHLALLNLPVAEIERRLFERG